MPDGRKVEDDVIDVDTVCYSILEMKDLDANVAGTNLESSQELISSWRVTSPLIH
ncbi:MAG: hypothetical protein WCF06_01455 [Nitrososphaeraceae archaeon]